MSDSSVATLLHSSSRREVLRQPASGYVAAAVGVAAMTGALYALPGAQHIANVSMLYLLVVVGLAVGFGRGPAVVASILSFFAFDWFFVEPRHTLTVKDPAEWLALVMFLFTAAVTGQMTALLRARAEEARRRERETAALAEASWAVASQVDRDRALAEVLHRLADVVSADAAGILLDRSEGGPEWIAWHRPEGTRPRPEPAVVERPFRFVLAEGRPVNWEGSRSHWEKALPGGHPDAAYLPLTMEHRVLGVLFLSLGKGRRPAPEERRVIESLANQAAVVIERDRLAQAETRSRALAEADRLKTALLSMVSHDFRSPLTSIKASVTGLLQEGAAWDPETQRELLHGIDRETDRLDRMVGNILALSRLEADAWRPRREPTSVPELFGAALDSFGREQNCRVRVELAPDLPEVCLDSVQIVQVLRNLVDNALKYSPADRPVELCARREGDRLEVEVLDRGPGLPEGEEGRIFEPFYRAPHLRESALPGVGIGLAVCRGLVEAHHGELTARNREGGGAVFRISLPSFRG